MDVQPTFLLHMRDAIMSVWTKLSKECFLVESMSRRIKAERGPTWYQQSLPEKVVGEYTFYVFLCLLLLGFKSQTGLLYRPSCLLTFTGFQKNLEHIY